MIDGWPKVSEIFKTVHCQVHLGSAVLSGGVMQHADLVHARVRVGNCTEETVYLEIKRFGICKVIRVVQ